MANNTKNYIKVSRVQFIGILLGAIISSAVTTTFAVVSTLNSDHFALVALGGRVETIERTIVPRGELEIYFKSIESRLIRMENKLDQGR